MATGYITNGRQLSGPRPLRRLAPLLMILLVTGCWKNPPKEIGELNKLGWSVQQLTDLVTVEKTGCTDADLATLSEYAQKLKEQKIAMTVVLAGSKITDAGLANIKSLVNVTTLDVSKTSVTSQGVAAIAGWTNLTSLDLSETKVNDDALAHLSKLTNLNSLTLNGCSLTGAGFGSLKELANLKSLRLNNTQVNDAGLAKLPPLLKLNNLRLDKTQITAASLSQFKKFSGLRELSLKEIAGMIDMETRKKFEDDNPDLQVDF